MNELTQYMKTRRSSLSLCLEEPGPDDVQLRTILEIATRVPDHGKLAPWRIVLWSMAARKEMHENLSSLLVDQPEIADAEKKQKGTDKILHGPCVLAVISKAEDGLKVPRWEQELSAGAVCMNTLIAANAQGFEAQWLTAWYVYDERAKDILQLKNNERVAGIIHIGSSSVQKNERPRPDVEQLFSTR
ncbi:MAG: nitroreductase [Rhizobiaceae bacterium]